MGSKSHLKTKIKKNNLVEYKGTDVYRILLIFWQEEIANLSLSLSSVIELLCK